jgi:hypothetical protein
MTTAATSIPPWAMFSQKLLTWRNVSPLMSVLMSRTASTVPQTPPRPPVSSAPPRAAAVMAWSSSPVWPVVGCADPALAVIMIPAMAQTTPVRA